MTALDCAWSAFNAALDRYPYDAMHPCRVEAREMLWMAQHPDWHYEPEADCVVPF
jgi:hypothetical protein